MVVEQTHWCVEQNGTAKTVCNGIRSAFWVWPSALPFVTEWVMGLSAHLLAALHLQSTRGVACKGHCHVTTILCATVGKDFVQCWGRYSTFSAFDSALICPKRPSHGPYRL